MSFINTKGKFHVALNGTGLLLEGAPGRLSYTVEQAPLYGTRFASGDRSYNDLAQWWYLIQTDWSGGIKETVSWEDDAKYYFSSNIDAQTRTGSIKLALAPASVHTFTENIICGSAARNSNVSTVYKYYGCDKAGTTVPRGYEYDNSSYTEIIAASLTTSQTAIGFVRANQRTAFFGIYGPGAGGGNQRCVVAREGGSTVDCTANIASKLAYTPTMGNAMASVNNVAYIFVSNADSQYSLVKTTVESPSADADWSAVVSASSLGIPVAAEGFGGNLYYLIYIANTMTLRKYDIGAATHTDVQVWHNVTLPRQYGMQNLLTTIPGKLIITVPNDQIWEYDGSTMTQIYNRNAYKVASISSTLAVGQLTYGAIASQNKAWWGNLSYDGTDFFNDVRPSSDADADTIQPLFSDEAEKRYYVESANTKIATAVDPSGSVYKTGASHSAMLILSQHDKLQSIDKLLSSVTVGFDPLVSGQSVEIYYTAAQTPTIAIADWTSLGTISYTADGGVVTSKVLKFPVGTLVKKVWIRINLVGGGSNTPTVNDASLEYQPQPTQKKLWSLNINARDEIKDLAGNLGTKTGRELKSVLQFAWWTKSLLDFQDLDYAATTLTSSLTSSASSCAVADTSDFPEQGRIKIGDEEIFYTGKTRLSFTGLTRGVRDTLAVAHSSSDEVHNGYSVIMTSYGEKVPLMHEDKQLESTVGVSVREV